MDFLFTEVASLYAVQAGLELITLLLLSLGACGQASNYRQVLTTAFSG